MPVKDAATSHFSPQDKRAVISFLTSSIQSFLDYHGFLPFTSDQRAGNRGSPSPRKRRKANFEGDSSYGEQAEICQPALTQGNSTTAETPVGPLLCQPVCAYLDVLCIIFDVCYRMM